jgi:hypothetical protein
MRMPHDLATLEMTDLSIVTETFDGGPRGGGQGQTVRGTLGAVDVYDRRPGRGLHAHVFQQRADSTAPTTSGPLVEFQYSLRSAVSRLRIATAPVEVVYVQEFAEALMAYGAGVSAEVDAGMGASSIGGGGPDAADNDDGGDEPAARDDSQPASLAYLSTRPPLPPLLLHLSIASPLLRMPPSANAPPTLLADLGNLTLANTNYALDDIAMQTLRVELTRLRVHTASTGGDAARGGRGGSRDTAADDGVVIMGDTDITVEVDMPVSVHQAAGRVPAARVVAAVSDVVVSVSESAYAVVLDVVTGNLLAGGDAGKRAAAAAAGVDGTAAAATAGKSSTPRGSTPRKRTRRGSHHGEFGAHPLLVFFSFHFFFFCIFFFLHNFFFSFFFFSKKTHTDTNTP